MREVITVSCDPQTIWALPEEVRPAAVTALVTRCAEDFQRAVREDEAGAAQDAAIYALASIAGLFPNPEDAPHDLLQSVISMITSAKSGRSEHILARSTVPICGTKRGFGHAYVGGYALSAVNVLVSRWLLSERSARKRVARMLANVGYSLRKGEHEKPKPITDSAIRNWRERADQYPLHNSIAAEMTPVHADNLDPKAAIPLSDVLEYLRGQAVKALHRSRGL